MSALARLSASAKRISYLTTQKVWGIAFLLPVLLLFLGFCLYPMLRAVEISFERYDLISPPRWIGLDNYSYVFSNERVLNSFRVTGVFVVD